MNYRKLVGAFLLFKENSHFVFSGQFLGPYFWNFHLALIYDEQALKYRV
jgi:hypothetical protein